MVNLVKKIFFKIEQKIRNKKILQKTKNYMYMHFDEVAMQKIYTPSFSFYVKLMLIPSAIVTAIFILLIVSGALTKNISSIIIGIWGSYLASVVVTWIVDAKTCKDKTFERMRFQHIYFSCLKETCFYLIYHNVNFLFSNFTQKAKEYLERNENSSNFVGYPWQSWCAYLQEIVLFDFLSEDEIEAVCDGTIKFPDEFSQKAEFFIPSIYSTDSFIEDMESTITQYKFSLHNAYIDDYIYYGQLLSVDCLLDQLQELLKLLKEQDYLNVWFKNNEVLNQIDHITGTIYAFKSLRQNEHIFYLKEKVVEKAVATVFEELSKYLDDNDNKFYTILSRNTYWKIKQQNKINLKFENENKATYDTGWK